MRRRLGLASFLMAIVAGGANTALAGMPSLTFSDIARMRLSGISFFLMILLISALAIQWLWNWLAKDFMRLPRLNYWRACGVVMLWGLLFVVVLTMISGARELMTPGAWEKQGATYRLREQPSASLAATECPPDYATRSPAERRLKLLELYHELQKFAQSHGEQFPSSIAVSAIGETRWNVTDELPVQFIYLPGRSLGDEGLPLAYEPAVYSGDPLVLLVGGEIVSLPRDRLAASP